MSVDININGQSSGSVYIGWTPQPLTLKLTVPQAAAQHVVLQSVKSPTGADVTFSTARNSRPKNPLTVNIPGNGSPVTVFVAGVTASTNDQDITIVANDAANNNQLATQTVMVRVRKNAQSLSTGERDRFLNALAKFNESHGNPNFGDFVTMHNTDANTEIHSTADGDNPRYSFLVWHRAFILDLERQLQTFDPSVTIPFWKFDEKAPDVFSPNFMGGFNSAGRVIFTPGHPLLTWNTNGGTGLIRHPNFNTKAVPRIPFNPPISTDAQTVALGDDFAHFRSMENNPHGYAHSCFDDPSQIADITRATQDPLFFLLHSNVDRIWALWQQQNNQYNIASKNTYPLLGTFGPGKPHRVGDYINDTMWPWNGETSATSTRPPSAPGGKFPQTVFQSNPSPEPKLSEMIDYQGYNSQLTAGFDYETIKFDFNSAIV